MYLQNQKVDQIMFDQTDIYLNEIFLRLKMYISKIGKFIVIKIPNIEVNFCKSLIKN
jgi:hypothetical protein